MDGALPSSDYALILIFTRHFPSFFIHHHTSIRSPYRRPVAVSAFRGPRASNREHLERKLDFFYRASRTDDPGVLSALSFFCFYSFYSAALMRDTGLEMDKALRCVCGQFVPWLIARSRE